MSKTIVDQQKIDWFLTHAVENVYPSREALREKLLSGERISIYLGIDPTGATLHMGHMIPIQKLAELQELGHQIILLIGDFTAMSGDPDKLTVRRQLTREEVLENCKLYQQQASKLLRFSGVNAAQLKFNNDWLSKLTFKEVVELASHFTVQQMLERDNFEKRMEEQKPIKLHEFLYPLMQGYDSVAMDVDMELGGNDQTFNMLAGRTLMKEMKHKEKFVLTTRLLVDSNGKKMGKTEGNMITMLDSADDMYGKVMSWTDEMIVPGFEICTTADQKELEEIKKKLKKENPMILKRALAHQIVLWLYDGKSAEQAAEHFASLHQKHEQPEEIPEMKIKEKSISLIEALVQSKLVESKSDARRQVEQGGVKVEGKVITDVKAMVTIGKQGTVIQKGKRHFVKLV
ncbi:tyrosine--tRNA ligase [Candidatus Uhrbacteria bacterium]|nr:tyrosine--tRNA ligase [Candidatus Uhrbacteria bacterium]